MQIKHAPSLLSQIAALNTVFEAFADTTGADLSVHFPAEVVEQKGLSPGSLISCWVRKAGQTRCFVHREHVQLIGMGGEAE